MTCEFSYDAGAYVLGALSPSERLAFERHLTTCEDCARSVRELAGLPGLLARVPAETLEHPAAPDPLPDTLLPRLARAARRDQRRRTWATAGLSAAAALILGTGVVAASGGLDGGSPADVARPAPSSPATTGSPTVGVGRAMVPLVATPITADLAMLDVAWGTRLHLVCSYDVDGTPRASATRTGSPATTGSGEGGWGPGEGGSSGGWGSGEGTGDAGGTGSEGAEEPREWVYSMVVLTKDGTEEQVATWKAVPGKTMRLDAATATSRDDIASVEVRTAGGRPLLELRS